MSGLLFQPVFLRKHLESCLWEEARRSASVKCPLSPHSMLTLEKEVLVSQWSGAQRDFS